MRRALLAALVLGAGLTLSASTAGAQVPEFFNPVTGLCDPGIGCMTSEDCAEVPGAPRCEPVGDGGPTLRCRPPLFFACCDEMSCAGAFEARTVLAVAGPACVCVPEPIAECFEAGTAPPISLCTTDPRTMLPVTTFSQGDCDGDRCPNMMDPEPCNVLVACMVVDGGPPAGDGGLDGGRDASLEAGADASRVDASVDASHDGGDDEDAGPLCPTIVLPDEDCGPDGLGNGCDDDANGTVDDGCVGELDAGSGEEDAAIPPPPPPPPRRDMGTQVEEDAGEEPEEDAGEEPPRMDAAPEDPTNADRVFRGSGGCGICSASGDRDATSWLGVSAAAVVVALLAARRRRRA